MRSLVASNYHKTARCSLGKVSGPFFLYTPLMDKRQKENRQEYHEKQYTKHLKRHNNLNHKSSLTIAASVTTLAAFCYADFLAGL